MASPKPDRDALLAEYQWFDETVDIVSAFEYLFTEQADMRATVLHFERFPSLPNPTGGTDLTPDFTVAFNDGSGLIGEVKRLPLVDQGVDNACKQLLAYDSVRQLPSGAGEFAEVGHPDVMLIVPIKIGTAALRRILVERLDDAGHFYKPGHPPIILQESRTADQYIFQHQQHPLNGSFREAGRTPGLGQWLARDSFAPQVRYFAHIKAARPFVNDPIEPLYLAVLLWTKVFSTLAHSSGVKEIGGYRPLVLTAAEIAEHLREMFGHGVVKDVERAMSILVSGQMAEEVSTKRWRIAFGERRSGQRRELADLFASNAVKPPKSGGGIHGLRRAYEKSGKRDPLTPKATGALEPGQLFNPDNP